MKRTYAALCLIVTWGCASAPLPPVRFQVVDGESRLPLAGVRVQQENLQPRMVFGSNMGEFINYPPTGPDGLLVTRPLPVDYEISLTFSRDGCLDSSALLGGDDVSIIAPVHTGRWVGRPDMVVPRAGLVTLPLYRVGSRPATRDSSGHGDPPGESTTRRPGAEPPNN